ncbi:MAG: HPF/RaiA family ribosome-associated protein [Deltaproteobacteria bacterium]|nr:HPF/RaiA family ribosome-associated protein [Candidatus Anaeroferrophillus wilburensis]MBN2889109.1 HPF/RaiA family ribosome-associated protein [Deltaproteobacteria bacterium]
MQVPLQISYRNLDPSPSVEDDIREKAAKLDQRYSDIMSCRVVVEMPHQHHQKGKLYHVRINLTLPGAELVVNREPDLHQAYQDIYVVVRDAFAAMERQLAAYVERRKGEIKIHELPPHGRVVRLYPDQHYGFIETSDGREVYFHAHSVLQMDFKDVEIGAEVRFSEEMGDHGPQASSVLMVGKHHLVD